MNVEYFKYTLQELPKSIGVDDVFRWLENFDNIDNYSEIESLYLEKNQSEHYYRAVGILYVNKYLREIDDYDTYEGKKIAEIDCEDKARMNISLIKSNHLTLNNCTNTDNLIFIGCSKVTEINCLNAINVQSLKINGCNKLDSLLIKDPKKIKSLYLANCNLFKNFEMIGEMENLLFLDISLNKYLTDISFLKNHKNLVELHIRLSGMLKNPDTIEILKTLPSLKRIVISGTIKFRREFGDQLPHLFGNF